jgi:hypothetical protein
MNSMGKNNMWMPLIIFTSNIHLLHEMLMRQTIILKQKQNIAPTKTIDHSLTFPDRPNDTTSSPST